MSDEQEAKPSNDSQNSEMPKSTATENVPDVKSHEESAEKQKDTRTYKEHPPVNVKADFRATEDTYSSPENVLQLFFLAVNVVLAIFTIALFYQTKESVKIANDALAISRLNDSLTRKQFNLQNTPYLQVGEFKYINDSTLDYTLFNLTEYPAKIVAIQMAPGSRWSKNPLVLQTQVSGDSMSQKFKLMYDPLGTNVYVIKDSPVERTYHGYFSGINKDGNRLYGKVWYINEITNEKRSYSFTVVLSGTKDKIQPEFHHNENGNVEGQIPAFIYENEPSY